MGYIPEDCAQQVVDAHISPTVFNLSLAHALSNAVAQSEQVVGTGRFSGEPLPIHIKLDTGMNRLGIKPYEDPVAVIENIASLPGLDIEGVLPSCTARRAIRPYSI